MYVSHRGNDLDSCGDWTLPCRSVRYAVRISSANDAIHIDYAKGKPYKECEHENHTIILDKSLSFHGMNGKAILHCGETSFFAINNPAYTTSKIRFSNLSLASRGILVDAYEYGQTFGQSNSIFSFFELGFNFCDIESSSYFVRALSLSCLLEVLNSNIQSDHDPISMECGNLTARLSGSNFASCPVRLDSGHPQAFGLNVHIYNCSFVPPKRQKSCSAFAIIFSGEKKCNITIKSSIFMNLYNLAEMPKDWAISIYTGSRRNETSIILDRLHFENINCGNCVVFIASYRSQSNEDRPFSTVGIFNTVFVNTTRAFVGKMNSVELYNNTFNTTRSLSARKTLISIHRGSYHFMSCHFFQKVPSYNPIAMLDVEPSATVTFENCSYESYSNLGLSGNLLHNNMFYIISAKSLAARLSIKGYFTMLCPQGYTMNLNTNCYSSNVTQHYCFLFSAFCQQCPRKTYSLTRGESHGFRSNHITCHACPVGGKCVEGQITSMPSFWGYVSNQTITFVQCPPKYCCDTKNCLHYSGCYGNRMGTLCGKCPGGMSESLFDTKCKPNKDCTSTIFLLGISAYLLLYLLFFLYQRDLINFLQKRFIPRIFSSARNSENSKSGGLLKILFYYYQTVYLLRNSVPTGTEIELLHNVDFFLTRAFNFLAIAIPFIDCPFPHLRPVGKAIIIHSVGFCLLAFLCLMYLSISVFKVVQNLRTGSAVQTVELTEEMSRRFIPKHNPFLVRIAGAFASISLLMYASSTKLCLSLLHCVQVGDSQVLFLDGNIKCHKTFQYFLVAYMITSILPFCLVPVFGSYLLKFGQIGVKQFCAACIFPLPFCCFWAHLLLKKWRCARQATHTNTEESDNTIFFQQQSLCFNEDTFVFTDSNGTTSRRSESAILKVLLGPFRPHLAFTCFASSHIPWEGFLIFRRLVLIVVLTFVYDIQLRLFAALIVCLAVLILHMLVNPFQRTRNNVIETFSLALHVILCGLILIKALYYGEDYPSYSKSLPVLKAIESIIVVAPLFFIVFVAFLSIVIKLVLGIKRCLTRNFGN